MYHEETILKSYKYSGIAEATRQKTDTKLTILIPKKGYVKQDYILLP